jgi:hypothetical protein
MIGLSFQLERDSTKRVLDAADKAAFKNLGHAASAIRKTAIESIKPAEGPSPPGTPPHTHTAGVTKKGKLKKGHLPRAIVYDVDKAKQEAVVGPRASVVGESGAAHELGEEFRGDDYPERPYMSPALEANAPRFADEYAGSIGE